MRRFLALLLLFLVTACAPVEGTPAAATEAPPTRIPVPVKETSTDTPISTPTATVVPTIQTTASADLGYTPGDFPLGKGTTWVYSYEEYEPDPNAPTQIITATYLFTDAVIATQSIPPFFIAHVQHEEHLVKADPGWDMPSPRRGSEFWYAIKGQQVFETPQALLDLTQMLLAFDLPLAPGKEWCPYTGEQNQKMVNCTYAGKISVGSQEAYSTPAGNFTKCYQLSQVFNSGGVNQWFCNGIGVVAEKYDHAGSRFGFQDTLISYTRGAP